MVTVHIVKEFALFTLKNNINFKKYPRWLPYFFLTDFKKEDHHPKLLCIHIKNFCS